MARGRGDLGILAAIQALWKFVFVANLEELKNERRKYIYTTSSIWNLE